MGGAPTQWIRSAKLGASLTFLHLREEIGSEAKELTNGMLHLCFSTDKDAAGVSFLQMIKVVVAARFGQRGKRVTFGMVRRAYDNARKQWGCLG